MARSVKQRVVVFDFDGVIADSWQLHQSSWQAVLKQHGATLDDDAIRKAMGWNSIETARMLIKGADLKVDPRELADEKIALTLEQADADLSVMPGAVAAVERLGEDFRLALVAARQRKLITPALKQFGLAKQFELVLTGDDMKPEDEADDLLTSAAEQLGVKPAQCAMVDDTRNGLLAAERAGMKTIAFDSNPKFKTDYSIADAAIKSLDELVPELVNSVMAR